ncbi:MAG: hypothetical protein Q8N44_07100 [Rubrivivax sp.]|nr:hypothetical protein [Rubrivivax sp.]MDP3083442.1 hypothetical protein [Rubrivivax sp.]
MLSRRRRFRAEVCSIQELLHGLKDQHLLPIKEAARLVGPLLAQDPPDEVYYLDPDDLPKLLPDADALGEWCFTSESGPAYRAQCLAAACGDWRMDLWDRVGIPWIEARMRFEVRDPVSYRLWRSECAARDSADDLLVTTGGGADQSRLIAELKAEIETHECTQSLGEKLNSDHRQEIFRQYTARMKVPKTKGTTAKAEIGLLWGRPANTIHTDLTAARKESREAASRNKRR